MSIRLLSGLLFVLAVVAAILVFIFTRNYWLVTIFGLGGGSFFVSFALTFKKPPTTR